MSFAIIVFVAGVAYTLSAIASFFEKTSRFALPIAFVGFVAQFNGLLTRSVEIGAIPTGSPYELLEVIVCIFAGTQLAFSILKRNIHTGTFSMLPIALLTLLPFGCPLFIQTLQPSNTSAVASAKGLHALLAALSYACMGASACFGIMYLRQKKSLREKSSGGKFLPALETLSATVALCIEIAFFAMIISIAIGLWASLKADSNFFELRSIKFIAATILLIIQTIVYILVVSDCVHGTRLAKVAIGMAVFACLLLVPIQI